MILPPPRSDLSIARCRRLSVGACFLVALVHAEPMHELPDLRVGATGVERVQSAQESLTDLPRLTLRSQGTPTSQSDLRIRGSAFSGAGLTLAGLALRNPQTEHFHAELPISPGFLTPFRVATGLDQAFAGQGHLVGAAVAEFATPGDGGAMALEAGEGGGTGTRVFVEQSRPGGWGLQFEANTRHFRGQDYGQNDVTRRGGSLHLQRTEETGTLDLALGYQHSEFGARGYYGVSPTAFPDAHEKLRDLLAIGSWATAGPAQTAPRVRASASVRRLEDQYALDENDPGVYLNEHATTTSAVAIDRRPTSAQTGWGWLGRIALEDERIDSTGHSMWDPAYDGLGNHDRQRLDFTLVPRWKRGAWRLHAGGKGVVFSEERPEVLGLAGASARMTDGHRLMLSVAETVRQPSYTELNYESPGSLGNGGLENQTATETELAWEADWSPGFATRAAVFHRTSRNTVDWIRSAAAAQWQASDIGTVQTDGLELTGAWTAEAASARLGYTALSKNTDTPYHASRYAMDYARHRVTASARVNLPAECELRTIHEYIHFADNPARTSGNTGVAGRLGLVFTPEGQPFSLAATVHNLWDEDLQSFPGQLASGRWAQIRLTGTW